jgi:Major royal jelly protein
MPRVTDGIPVTLGYLKETGSQIIPYPNYDWHSSNGRNCDGLTSVFRVAIDKCNNMWVLDTGRIDNEYKCSPQLVVFNLKTDRLVHRYRFTRKFYTDSSLFVTPVSIRRPFSMLNMF